MDGWMDGWIDSAGLLWGIHLHLYQMNRRSKGVWDRNHHYSGCAAAQSPLFA